MKRVAIFRASVLPLSETFVRDQAAALGSWQPVLVGFGEVADGLATPGIPREIVPLHGRRADLDLLLGRPIESLTERLRRGGFSLVHAHFGPDAVRIWPSVRRAGLPLLVTLHGFDITVHAAWWRAGNAGWTMRLYPGRMRAMARHPRVRFLAVSAALRQRAIDYGLPADKVDVAYTGVDTARFQPGGAPVERRKPRILFVGRLVEKKGPALMVLAFAKVREQVEDAELVMVGTGPLLQDVVRLARELAVPVDFRGASSSDHVLSELQQARVLCLPSVTASNGDAEGFGMVLLEAQACGVPVVTSAQGGATEGLQEGRTGFSFREGDVEDLVRKLVRVLEDSGFVRKASTDAVRFVRESFDLRMCTRALERYYDRHAGVDHDPR